MRLLAAAVLFLNSFLLILTSAKAAAPAVCPFCAIAAGKQQQEGVVYHDDQVTAFLSLGARNPGHILIVPNQHFENFMTLPDATMHHMTDVAKVLVEALKRTDLKCEGFMLQMSNGKPAGQS